MNFNLDEYTYSFLAAKYGFIEQNIPLESDISKNLEILHTQFITPIREYLTGNLIILEGYTCFRLWELTNINTSDKSSCQGKSIRLNYNENGIRRNDILLDAITNLKLSYTKLIKCYGTIDNPLWIQIVLDNSDLSKRKLVVK